MFPMVALLSVGPLLHSPSSRRPPGLTILLVLRQKLRDPIVRGLPNYGNLINLFKQQCADSLCAVLGFIEGSFGDVRVCYHLDISQIYVEPNKIMN